VAAAEEVEARHATRRSRRQEQLRSWAAQTAPHRQRWLDRNRFYYDDDHRYMRFLIQPGLRVLELGCGTGHLLAELRPSHGVGVDLSPEMIEVAQTQHPELEFVVGNVGDAETLARLGGPFDVIVLSDAIGYLEDCQTTFAALQPLCHRDTRVVISYFSQTWRPVLKVAEKAGAKMPQPAQNWLSPHDIDNLLRLVDFEPISWEWRLLLPRRLRGIGPFVNRYLGTLPGVRRLSLRHYVVARSLRHVSPERPSASVIIPCRNEAGTSQQRSRASRSSATTSRSCSSRGTAATTPFRRSSASSRRTPAATSSSCSSRGVARVMRSARGSTLREVTS
jgi:SAM-dependent methyltransferase